MAENPDYINLDKKLSDTILKMVENEIEQVISFHTSPDYIKDWNLNEIYEVAATIFPVDSKLKEDLSALAGENHKLDKIKVRTKIIEHLVDLAKVKYQEMINNAKLNNYDWREVEKSVLIRSIDMLWVEHLETMDYMRRGIGLRGYGQRDPLVEYKKEAFSLYSELNNLIQKEVVYSIYKIGGISEALMPNLLDRATFEAPVKEMSDAPSFPKLGEVNSLNFVSKPKQKDAEGHKIGRNDPCPCNSGKKYKRCHGK